ncbi:MAG: transcription elongation factor subunit Spt4 [Sulfolobales archaeon]
MSSRGRRSSIAKSLKACRNCKALVDINVERCPVCGSTDFTEEWSGMIIVFDPERSRVAHMLGIKKPGRYAVKLGGRY